MASRFDLQDWRNGAAMATDSTARLGPAGGRKRCEVRNDAESQCVYGAEHTIETHLFADGSRG